MPLLHTVLHPHAVLMAQESAMSHCVGTLPFRSLVQAPLCYSEKEIIELKITLTLRQQGWEHRER